MITQHQINHWLELCDTLRGQLSDVQYRLAELDAARYHGDDLAPVAALLTKAQAAANTLFGHITGMEFEAGHSPPPTEHPPDSHPHRGCPFVPSRRPGVARPQPVSGCGLLDPPPPD